MAYDRSGFESKTANAKCRLDITRNMMDTAMDNRLEEFIDARNRKKGLKLSTEKLFYSRIYVTPELREHGENVLYVGIGHGLNVIQDLVSGTVQNAVGVDPYIEGHGNDHQSFLNLLDFVKESKLSERLAVHYKEVQEYLPGCREKFSAVVCFDVLHHIFITADPISRSRHAKDAIILFKALREKTMNGGLLLVGETQRYGLRQLLWRFGVLPSRVNYRTKQNFSEWRMLIEQSGFKLLKQKVYIPWVLRKFKPIFDNFIGLHTVSDRSISIYKAI